MRSENGWVRSTTALILLLVLYFVAPLGSDDPLPLAVSLLLGLVGVAALGWVITRQVAHHIRGEQTAALHSLLVLLWLVVVVFATAFFQLDRTDGTQLVDLETRLDSLYFVLSTLATVG